MGSHGSFLKKKVEKLLSITQKEIEKSSANREGQKEKSKHLPTYTAIRRGETLPSQHLPG